MLVIDVDALRTVDLLNFLHQIVLQRRLAFDAQDVVRIERAVRERIARKNARAVFDREVRVELHLVLVFDALVIDDRDDLLGFGVFQDLHRPGVFRDDRFALGFTGLEDLFNARQARDDVFLSHAAGVEGAQRQLRAWFADRLRRDDPDGLADVDRLAGRQIAAVAHRAHAILGLTREHRADLHVGDARGDDRFGLLFVDLFVARDDLGPRLLGIFDIGRRTPADDTVVDRLDRFAADLNVGDGDAVGGPAIFLADDDVLRDIDEPAREVARVRRTQGGIGKPLTRAVGRNEVLQNRQAFFERSLDRDFEDAAGRIGHESAHTTELLDLRDRTART